MISLVKVLVAVKNSHIHVFRVCIEWKEMKIQIAKEYASDTSGYFVLIWLCDDG